MSRVPTGLASGTLSSGDNSIYTASNAIIITSLVLTNTDSSIKSCDISIDRDSSLLFETVAIPSGNGKAVDVTTLADVILNGGDVLKINSDSASINYDLSGWVVS